MNAREEVLARVRTALGEHARLRADQQAVTVPRAYRTTGEHPAGHPALLDLFTDRLLDYRARVTRCAPSDIAGEVAAALGAAGAGQVAVPPGLPEQWRPVGGPEIVVDDDLTALSLDGLDGALTGCATAIAETGTIVLDGSGACGRRALTLVPDLHVCVVLAEQVVAAVPDGLARLDARRPLTFISGPSATSDIELRRVEGVHGPRTLHVVLVQ